LNLAIANQLESAPKEPPGLLLVAFDVLGGKFAINGGALSGGLGELCYFAPDELVWCPMGMGHGAFVAWAMTEQLALFNEHLRWPGWEREVEALGNDQGLSLYPFPFTAEGQDLAGVSRTPVPIDELFTVYEDFEQQLGGVRDGEEISVVLAGQQIRRDQPDGLETGRAEGDE
jgi:hypothetical protein